MNFCFVPFLFGDALMLQLSQRRAFVVTMADRARGDQGLPAVITREVRLAQTLEQQAHSHQGNGLPRAVSSAVQDGKTLFIAGAA